MDHEPSLASQLRPCGPQRAVRSNVWGGNEETNTVSWPMKTRRHSHLMSINVSGTASSPRSQSVPSYHRGRTKWFVFQTVWPKCCRSGSSPKKIANSSFNQQEKETDRYTRITRKAQHFNPAQSPSSPYVQSHQTISASALKLPLLMSTGMERFMALLAGPPP